jgi:hypothetical protein
MIRLDFTQREIIATSGDIREVFLRTLDHMFKVSYIVMGPATVSFCHNKICHRTNEDKYFFDEKEMPREFCKTVFELMYICSMQCDSRESYFITCDNGILLGNAENTELIQKMFTENPQHIGVYITESHNVEIKLGCCYLSIEADYLSDDVIECEFRGIRTTITKTDERYYIRTTDFENPFICVKALETIIPSLRDECADFVGYLHYDSELDILVDPVQYRRKSAMS